MDANEIGDLAPWIIGSKVKKLGEGDPVNIFNMSSGMPGWVYDLLDTLGLDSKKYRPKVYTVTVKVDNPLVTDSKAEARKAKSMGYDSVIYYGSGTVDNVPEVAVYDPSKVAIKNVQVW